MANITSGTKSVHKTLTSTTPDKITLKQNWTYVEVINRVGTANLYVTTDGATAPVAAADNTEVVLPGEAVVIKMDSEVVWIIGDGNEYSVIGVE